MDETELTDKLVEEFNCNRSDAKNVSNKVAKYINEKEDSELTESMKDPDYIPAILRENATNGNLITRWNQWIGQFSKDSRYKVE